MDTGSTERLRPACVGNLLSLGQQIPETPVSSDNCGAQNEQLEAGEPSRQQEANKTGLADSHELQNVVDRQGRVGEPHRPDFRFLQSMLDAQREKIHEQLQELQKVVVLQCRITGTNPLAQEMAAVVLGNRVGKKLGDLLTPKALKCLYNVFSIKDTITKKEAREISALCGATVTQVREFFAGQRSRVRKVVLSSHIDQGSDDRLQSIHLDLPALVGLHSGENPIISCSPPVVGNQCNHLDLLENFCGKPDGISSKLYPVEKAEHLINVMHKESTFTGQSQLAQVIMQAHDSVLRCFMARGGLQQIIRWLIQAAAEEQTSLIRLILKAINQLPLGSALPRHMSLLLQTVNKLRFYRAQDVASRARSLLSRWSRFCKSTQSGKLVSSTGIARSSQPGQKRSRDCTHSSTVDDASKKKAKAGSVAVDSGKTSDVVSSSLVEDMTVHERPKPETAAEISNTKKRPGSFLIQGDRAKEKRKVQLFEETRAATRRRDAEVPKPSSVESSSRPLSADDIKKAKMRAYYLNNAKAEKPSSSKLDASLALDLSIVSFERGPKRMSGNFVHRLGRQEFLSKDISEGSLGPSMEKGQLEPAVSAMDVKALSSSTKCFQTLHIQSDEPAEAQVLTASELSMDMEQSEFFAYENAMDMMPSFHWTLPRRLALDPRWKVAVGELSTEAGSETKRLSTVLEATYPSPHCIPSNPAEPAERVCLFVDDALVPEILLEAVDEEGLERDSSLQSPRDLEPKEVCRGEDDSQKVDTHTDHKLVDSVRSSMIGTPTSTAHIDGIKPVAKLFSATDAINNMGVSPLELSISTSVEKPCVEVQPCVEVRRTEFLNEPTFIQPRNLEAYAVFRDPTLVAPSTTNKASTSEPSQAPLVVKEDILSLTQRDMDGLRATTSSAPNMEMPPLLNQAANPRLGDNSSGVDLSELSKETCMDMLNIVLQQLADNAKGSGADLDLLSVFLKNPQLVHSLMSSQAESLGKGLPATFTGSDLGQIISSSTVGSLGNQLEELVGRNIGQVANSVKELASTGCFNSEIREPVSRTPITAGGPQSHPLLSSSIPQPLAAIDSAIQLLNSQSKVTDGSQFLKHPSIQETSSSRNSDYDWSQPYDYPPGGMHQGTGLGRHLVHPLTNIDRSISNSAYSQTPTGHAHAFSARASQSPSSIMQTDQRVQPSMHMYVGNQQLSPSVMHAEWQEERATIRRNGFCGADIPTNHMLPNSHSRAPGISDGLLPVPDGGANNHRLHPSKVMHESHLLHGGTMPAFAPVSPAAIGHQAPHHINNGPYYCDQSFKPQLGSSSHPPYLSHGRSPSSFHSNPIRSQGNPNLWRPPPYHSNRPKNARPRWREG